jgi:hypothetical protein
MIAAGTIGADRMDMSNRFVTKVAQKQSSLLPL